MGLEKVRVETGGCVLKIGDKRVKVRVTWANWNLYFCFRVVLYDLITY
jgi:hypothetical protein